MFFRSVCFSAVSLSLVLLTAGCNLSSPVTTVAGTPEAGEDIQGILHGGQQAIVGAHVFLFAANTTGYGNASVSLLKAASNTTQDTSSGGPTSGDYFVTTDAYGAFTIDGDYTCPSNSPQVYLYAVGGDPGAGANSAAGGLALLGTCPAGLTLASAAPAVTFVSMNEVSTIAAAYAIAGFATDATHISSSGSALALTDIANAFKNATNLADLATGLPLATTPAANGGNGIVPQTELVTLANVLASCVNSTGPGGTGCVTLLPTATSDGTASGIKPTDTATAAINIAHHPGSNIKTLYDLQTSASPFQTGLSTQPNDFTIALTFSGGGLYSPEAIAIDATGNAWVSSQGYYSQFFTVPSSIDKFSSAGAALSPASGYTAAGGATGIAIDLHGNLWLSEGQIAELSSSGTLMTSVNQSSAGLSAAGYVAIDARGEVWVTSQNTQNVAKLSSSGSILSGTTGYSGGGLSSAGPGGVAIDGAGHAWIAATSVISELTNSGTAVSAPGYGTGGLGDAFQIAIDSAGDAWITGHISGQTVVKLSNSGSVLYTSNSSTGGGLTHPAAVALDGAGNAWIANNASGGVLSELSSSGAALSPSTGYTSEYLNTGSNPAIPIPFNGSLAVDGSGDVWVCDQASLITEFIGIATPVITPIAAGLPTTPTANGTSNLATRP